MSSIELRESNHIRWSRNDAGLDLVNSQTNKMAGMKRGKHTFGLKDRRKLDIRAGNSQHRHIDCACVSRIRDEVRQSDGHGPARNSRSGRCFRARMLRATSCGAPTGMGASTFSRIAHQRNRACSGRSIRANLPPFWRRATASPSPCGRTRRRIGASRRMSAAAGPSAASTS